MGERYRPVKDENGNHWLEDAIYGERFIAPPEEWARDLACVSMNLADSRSGAQELRELVARAAEDCPDCGGTGASYDCARCSDYRKALASPGREK